MPAVKSMARGSTHSNLSNFKPFQNPPQTCCPEIHPLRKPLWWCLRSTCAQTVPASPAVSSGRSWAEPAWSSACSEASSSAWGWRRRGPPAGRWPGSSAASPPEEHTRQAVTTSVWGQNCDKKNLISNKQFLNISKIILAACWGEMLWEDVLQPSVATNSDQSSRSISVLSSPANSDLWPLTSIRSIRHLPSTQCCSLNIFSLCL